jgi:hypothetical protein
MKNPASLARRLSRVSTAEKTAKPIEITEIVEGAHCTAAYIAQLTGELATLADGARFANLAFFSPGPSSKPSFGRVQAIEDRVELQFWLLGQTIFQPRIILFWRTW